MRLLQYTIIIWTGLAFAGEVEPIHSRPIENEPVVRHDPPIRPIEPPPVRPRVKPIESIHPVVEPPIHGGPSYDPFPSHRLPIHPEPIGGQHLIGDEPTGEHPRVKPSSSLVPKEVQTYLSQHGQLPEMLKTIVLPESTSVSVEQVRVQYLEVMQKSFEEGLLTVPKVVLPRANSFIQEGVGPFLVKWVVSITDGLSFAEYLSKTAISPEKKEIYDATRAEVLKSAQTLLDTVASLHKQYASFFVMGKRTTKNLTEQEMKGLSDAIGTLEGLLETSVGQRRKLITVVGEQSPLYDEIMTASVIDRDSALMVWKTQEKISEQDASTIPASYEAFINGFLYATDVKEYVQKCIGKKSGQFASVQALVDALDKMGFIVESKFWLSFHNKTYSKSIVDKILSSLVKEYPDVYIPSEKFVLQYCKLHRIFKPISFFIPDYEQFLIDAKVLTIDELAKKYGQSPEYIKSLLNNAYEAMYVLQQTNQNKQASAVSDVVNGIMVEYPSMVPDSVLQVVASETIAIQALFDAQIGLGEMAGGLKAELVLLQTGQLEQSLTGVSFAINRAQKFIKQSLSRAESFLTDKLADRAWSMVQESSLGVVVKGVLNRLQDTESMVVMLTGVKESFLRNSSAMRDQYQGVLDQLQVLKEETMRFAVQVEYERAKAQQDRVGLQLMETLQNAATKELLSYTNKYFKNSLMRDFLAMEGGEGLGDGGGGDQTDTLIAQLAIKSALEKQNEGDYEACIWASNKMGMMESKIMSISALLKIKKTSLFLSGYENVLKDLEADFLFLSSSQSVQKCLNVIARRSFLLQKIKALETEIKALQKKIDDEQKTKGSL